MANENRATNPDADRIIDAAAAAGIDGPGPNGNSDPGPAAGTGPAAAAGTKKKKPAGKDDGLAVKPGIPEINIPQPTAPAQPKKKIDKALDKNLESNVRMLLLASFPMADKLAQNPVPIWTISDEEAASISTPLTKILQRLGASETMNKYADYIALFVALGIVTAPRVMIQVELNKAKQGQTPQVEVKKNERKSKANPANTGSTGGATAAQSAAVPGGIASLLDYGT